MRRFLSSPWFTTLSGGLFFLAPLAAFILFLPVENHTVPVPAAEAMIWNPQNTEIDLMVKELQKEKEELKLQKSELQKLSDQLKAERTELDEVAARIAVLQEQFDQNIVQIKTDEAANLKKQSRIYASMSPETAAQLLQETEEKAAVKLLASMKEEESGLILEALVKKNPSSAKKAALLAEQLRKVFPEKKEKQPDATQPR